jgi:hypothetical protein
VANPTPKSSNQPTPKENIQMSFISKKSVAAVVGSVVVAGGGFGAFAAYNWTATSSSANGAVNAYTMTATATAGTASADSNLYPGGSGGSLSLGVGNNNPFGVKITAVSLGTPSVNSGAVTDCALSTGNSLTGASLSNAGGTNLTLANGDTSDTLTLPESDLTMGTAAGNDCQGATITVPVTVTFTQNASS